MTTDNGTAVIAPTVEAISEDSNNAAELDKKIIRQVEYYFGDYNFGRDKFLKETTAKDDGWFSLEILVKFNRLKSLTTDFEVITNALKKSSSGLLEIHEDGTKIRRSKEKPLPTYDERRQEEIDSRSVYVKGFPTDLTIDDLLAYFKQHGNVEHVQMRFVFVDKNKKTNENKNLNQFKGSVFIVYSTKEEAVEFQKKESVKYKDADLLREMRQDYFSRKREERLKHKEQKKKEKNEGNKAAMDTDDNEIDTSEFEKGCILHLSNVPESMRHEEIKVFFQDHAAVAFVDHRTGQVEADIRFREPKAQEAMDKAKGVNDGKLVIKDAEVTARVLEGDEEAEYWKKSLKDRERSRQRKQNYRGGGRGYRGRFGGGRGRFNRNRDGVKRQADKSTDEPADKKEKLSEPTDNTMEEKAVADQNSTSSAETRDTSGAPEVIKGEA